MILNGCFFIDVYITSPKLLIYYYEQARIFIFFFLLTKNLKIPFELNLINILLLTVRREIEVMKIFCLKYVLIYYAPVAYKRFFFKKRKEIILRMVNNYLKKNRK